MRGLYFNLPIMFENQKDKFETYLNNSYYITQTILGEFLNLKQIDKGRFEIKLISSYKIPKKNRPIDEEKTTKAITNNDPIGNGQE